MIFGMSLQKQFMKILVRLAVFGFLIAFFYQLHFFDPIDPTVLSRRNPIEGYALAFFAIVIAFVAQYVSGIFFKKSLRFGPTLIGCIAGYWFAIYLILGVNGFFSTFQNAGAADFISPVWSMILEFMGVILGGAVGNCYSFIFILAIQTFISAYLVMRGCTLLINFGYPNEMVMMQAATSETNNLIHLGYMFYFYITFLLVMWIAALRY